MIKNKKMNKNK